MKIECNNISKVYKEKEILKNVSFSLAENQIIGLIGPNGAGKTTLMKLMTGLSKISSGSLLVDKQNVYNDFPNYIQKVGAVIETPMFYDYLNGFDCLNYFAKIRGVKKEYISYVVQLVGLTQVIHQRVKTYSLGMKQRLGIAQALLNKPELLILDEPFNGLDPLAVKDLRDLLLSLKNSGTTIFISSHTLNELELICDSAILLQDGEIQNIVMLANKEKGITIQLKTSNNVLAREVIQLKLPNLNLRLATDYLECLDVSPDTLPEVLTLLTINQIDLIEFKEVQSILQTAFDELIGEK
ncbi:ABC transporter ATP-binding protein [Listeria monocytogenes]|uniref:ABC transporter ATP-binding protein n=1 Tax=Listeria monocytogenes TaxID=1639 RepID=UPI0011EB808E|nr:ABC transporter ATP-binding protein [Listeria monocytogenes]EHK4067726.1 ABC transporter ATP-binding protein [Listeria monocytogenes]TYV33140.1 ABC transporter ATP-binding protein [Listeria monocytogenes]HBC0574188.1 ABC transporter ATP-binding protein [Listeria monocytogenes]